MNLQCFKGSSETEEQNAAKMNVLSTNERQFLLIPDDGNESSNEEPIADSRINHVERRRSQDEIVPSDRNSSSEVHQKTSCFLYILTLLSAIGGFLFGYDTGVVSGAVVLLKDEFNLDSLWQEAFVSITIAAAAIFSIVAGFINDGFGRKPTIIMGSIVFTAGAIFLGVANRPVELLIGRFILGIGIGFASATIPMYIAESAPNHLRGRLVTLNNIFITGGQFVACIVASLFSYDTVNGWRYMLGLAAIPAVIQMFGFLLLPESPRWLLTKGYEDEAFDALSRIRGHTDVHAEMTEIRSTCETRSGFVLWKMLSSPRIRRALLVGSLLQLFQQICGINTVMYYSATIIKMSGIVQSNSAAIWLATLTAGVNFIFTFVGLYLVERIGRRPLTIASLTGVLASLVVLAVGFQLADVYTPQVTFHDVIDQGACGRYNACSTCVSDTSCGYCYVSASGLSVLDGSCLPVAMNHGLPDTDQSLYGQCNSTHLAGDIHWAYNYCPTSFAWMATFGLVLYLVFFAPGMGPMPWTINSEIYPLWARSTGNSITTCVNWLSNLLISMTFLTLTEVITKYGVFWLYSGFALVGVIFFTICLPETKGKAV